MVNKKLTTKQNNSLFEDVLKDYSQYCGIDEAGRGPIAGPLVMAGVILLKPIEGLADSKKLSEKRREILYKEIQKSAKFFIYQVDAHKIDEIGLSRAIKESLFAIKERLQNVKYLFDGNCTFGVDGIETMVKADTKVDSVSAASILAKVTRDRLMVAYAKTYPNYGFENHKGYGTKAHLKAIAEYGCTPIHRKSFKGTSKNR